MMIEITIPGEPIPKARARHSTSKTKTGRTIVRTYTPEKTVCYERKVQDAAFLAMHAAGKKIITGPCRVEIEFLFGIPESWPTWKKEAAEHCDIRHTSKPDIDNLIKSVFDGLNGIAWMDDAQVISVTASKRFGAPKATIWIVDCEMPGSQIKNKSDLRKTA